jgi:hypothetical protein
MDAALYHQSHQRVEYLPAESRLRKELSVVTQALSNPVAATIAIRRARPYACGLVVILDRRSGGCRASYNTGERDRERTLERIIHRHVGKTLPPA